MRDIIEELYSGSYEPKFHASKEYMQRNEADRALWDQVSAAFGIDFVDDLWSSVNALSAEEEQSMFRHGFHLGALLMLDLLYDPPQPV